MKQLTITIEEIQTTLKFMDAAATSLRVDINAVQELAVLLDGQPSVVGKEAFDALWNYLHNLHDDKLIDLITLYHLGARRPYKTIEEAIAAFHQYLIADHELLAKDRNREIAFAKDVLTRSPQWYTIRCLWRGWELLKAGIIKSVHRQAVS